MQQRSLPQYAEVALGLPLMTTFHYRIPKLLQKQVALGKRVQVPFGYREMQGYLVAFVSKPQRPALKSILEVPDEEPLLDAELLTLTRWISSTYQAGWGEAIEAALPGPLRRGRTSMKSRIEESTPKQIPTQPLRLTLHQQQALTPILQAIQKKQHHVFLLHGVTGSGKTEIYLQSIQEVIQKKHSSIVLVPEIALTPQTIERFQARFGPERVAVLHSRMLESQRLREWQRIREGQAQVVIGARSAVFAPVRSLGLIVVDEEHEPSYKQADVPRYHAREVAIERAHMAQATVILGSATPALETCYRAGQRKPNLYHLLELPKRIEEVPLPHVQIVDMRREWEMGRRNKIFSRPLEEAIAETLESRQQAILFLNRRGFSTFVHCRSCGKVLRCPSCQVTLTYHVSERTLLCHTCHRSAPLPSVCPKCKSEVIRFQGTGTERVESDLARLFPHARIDRMDTDVTKTRGAHEKILKRFSDHEIDVLVGTQMIAKGLDFPRVTLVGVISADTALNLPDFRSSERTFNLLTQVAGRAGRGKNPGRVIVQTYAPHHYAIEAASRHDYATFYRKEILLRQQLQLPPFTRLVQLTIRSQRESKALQFSQEVAKISRRKLTAPIQVLGPAPAAIPRMRRQYRWQVLIKVPEPDLIQEKLSQLLRELRPPRGTHLAVDVDPL